MLIIVEIIPLVETIEYYTYGILPIKTCDLIAEFTISCCNYPFKMFKIISNFSLWSFSCIGTNGKVVLPNHSSNYMIDILSRAIGSHIFFSDFFNKRIEVIISFIFLSKFDNFRCRNTYFYWFTFRSFTKIVFT
jgi:hypothetical protein